MAQELLSHRLSVHGVLQKWRHYHRTLADTVRVTQSARQRERQRVRTSNRDRYILSALAGISRF